MAFSDLATHRDDPKAQYGYIPTEWIAILFIVLFSITTLLHVGQAIRSRIYWLLATSCIAGLLEIIGWAGRLWSSKNPYNLSPYIMQTTMTIIAPTFLVATNFAVLGQIIRRLGQGYSRLSAMWYTIVFISCDIIALLIQAIGGGNASAATKTNKSPKPGGNIVLGGICFQLAAITCYMILAAEFVVRFIRDRPVRKNAAEGHGRQSDLDRNMKFMLAALAASSIFIYIRSIYRTIELSDGWTGKIPRTQVWFDVFDGAMILLAMFTMNFLHPGRLLGSGDTWLTLKNKSEDDVESIDGKSQTEAKMVPA
ncbi:RTA1-domain-containing protein [Amylocystis lapponica]|nr:RTA1-domain-containing protein [Amylocystis lapponica]